MDDPFIWSFTSGLFIQSRKEVGTSKLDKRFNFHPSDSLLVHNTSSLMALVRASGPQTSSASTTSRYCRYHVFLSFRGQDTRKTFTDHLYTALVNAGFQTFRDDDEVEKGEGIEAELRKAIEQSRTSVIVFSKNYASSRWCLDELIMILERKSISDDHVVLPVFYDVDPSDVRKQKGSLAKAFARHQKTQPSNKVKEWREALAEVTDPAGMVLQNQADGHESKFINKIVQVIGEKLRRRPQSVPHIMIGMHSRVNELNLWLQHGWTILSFGHSQAACLYNPSRQFTCSQTSIALVRAADPQTSFVSNTSRYCHYHVFLSFRGQDTSKTFADHLYMALVNAGFQTFRNNDEVEKGEGIDLELWKAIKHSRTSVIVLSKNYASSRWCLDELVMILERKRISADHVVLPVFYDVCPSEVRNQTGSLAKAFARHQKTQPSNKVEEWRKALKDVANLAGMVLQNQVDGHESKFIIKIVQVIGEKLRHRPLSVPHIMIGMHSRVNELNVWLQDGSDDVGILVIFGMSGIGKTTIAKSVYDSNFERFRGSSFLENIKEVSQQQNGLVQLQTQLLSDILNGRKTKISSVSEGLTKIEDALSSKKVLLVLDDVDHMDQLDAVFRMKDQFYPGSKIIITTRRARLLKAHQVTKMHEVETLHYKESLELFSWHAFGQDHPIEGYIEYSQKLVDHCGGLPLALKVLGSCMYSEDSIDVWKSALEKLEAIPNGEIVNKLRVSYDSLQDDHDRNLFLHIACFFVGKDKDYIVNILDGCDFRTIVGIQHLIDRCLVSIHGKEVQMHDMILGMGRQIVRLESEKPWRRSRVWQQKDAFNILREKNGTDSIEGLVLDMRMLPRNSHINSTEIVLETNAFARMHELKLLHLSHVQLDGSYAEFCTRLRWLCWNKFPLDSIPTDFPLGSLVVLEMQYSGLRQVFKGTKRLSSLKILDLSHSHSLTEITNFSFCPNLEKLILIDCERLVDVSESIGILERLVYLSMKDCKNIRMLPENMFMLKSLETLIISGCTNLNELSIEMLRNMEFLKVLEMDEIPITQLWPGRSSCFLSSLPCSLVDLSVWGCNLSDDDFPRDFRNLSSLRRLNVGNNPICSLPNCIQGLTSLDELSFPMCTRLKSLVGLPEVDDLNIVACISLEKITYQHFPHHIYVDFHHQDFHHVQISSGDNRNLVEWEDWFKVEPIGRVDVDMINLLGLCNLESMAPIWFRQPLCDAIYRSPVQGLYEHGIFSTFFAGNEVPGRFSHKSRRSSISFTVTLADKHRIQALVIFAVYASSGFDFQYPDGDVMARVRNKSKGLKWHYGPTHYGIPGEGEDMIWLSHWKFQDDHLKGGDQVVVSVVARPCFRVKEFGIQIVQEQEENHNTMMSTQHKTIQFHPWYSRPIFPDETCSMMKTLMKIQQTKKESNRTVIQLQQPRQTAILTPEASSVAGRCSSPPFASFSRFSYHFSSSLSHKKKG